jgi:acetoin utilization deacetylase AcuC-like enzyme
VLPPFCDSLGDYQTGIFCIKVRTHMSHDLDTTVSGPPAVVGVVDDPSFDLHRSPGYHPERPERLAAARAAVERAGVHVKAVEARRARREELERVHVPRYLDAFERLEGERAQLDPDTYLAPDSVVAAERAAGGAVALVDAIVGGEFSKGAALLRPPGHHARPDRAMGFCLLNNVAIAAAHAIARGLGRVAIVDWDVHHGNGTQEMFFGDPRVLYVSLHQWPFYPGTGNATEIGEGEGRGYTVNLPMSSGARAGDYAAAFDRVVLPILEAYGPELVLVSAGFDAHRSDPLAGMLLEAPAFGWMTAALARIADKSARGRLALLLEGGYDLPALEESLAESLVTLAGNKPSPETPPPAPIHEAEILRTRKALREIWKVVA